MPKVKAAVAGLAAIFGCTADEISVAAQSLAVAGRISSLPLGRKGARIYSIKG